MQISKEWKLTNNYQSDKIVTHSKGKQIKYEGVKDIIVSKYDRQIDRLEEGWRN